MLQNQNIYRETSHDLLYTLWTITEYYKTLGMKKKLYIFLQRETFR